MNKKYKQNGGEMEFGMLVLIFLVALFALWVFTGGEKHESATKPFIIPGNDTNAPLQVYDSKKLN